MIDVSIPDNIAEMSAQAVTLFADGDSNWVTDDTSFILGRPSRTFEECVTDHVTSFSCPSDHARRRRVRR